MCLRVCVYLVINVDFDFAGSSYIVINETDFCAIA